MHWDSVISKKHLSWCVQSIRIPEYCVPAYDFGLQSFRYIHRNPAHVRPDIDRLSRSVEDAIRWTTVGSGLRCFRNILTSGVSLDQRLSLSYIRLHYVRDRVGVRQYCQMRGFTMDAAKDLDLLTHEGPDFSLACQEQFAHPSILDERFDPLPNTSARCPRYYLQTVDDLDVWGAYGKTQRCPQEPARLWLLGTAFDHWISDNSISCVSWTTLHMMCSPPIESCRDCTHQPTYLDLRPWEPRVPSRKVYLAVCPYPLRRSIDFVFPLIWGKDRSRST